MNTTSAPKSTVSLTSSGSLNVETPATMIPSFQVRSVTTVVLALIVRRSVTALPMVVLPLRITP